MQAVERQEESLLGGAGVPLFSVSYQVEAARAVVVLAHGYAEHCGRYQELMRRLNEQGLSVYSWDWRSHGRSPGLPGMVESVDELVEDCDRLLERVKALHPGLPIYLMGHSTGGAIALLYHLRHLDRHDLAGLILSAPVVKLEVNPVLRRMSKLMSRLLPALQVVDAAPIEFLSHDEAVKTAAEMDPLFYKGRVRARTGYAILQAADEIQKNMHLIRIPLLIMQGDMDKVVDPNGASMLHDAVSSLDKTLIHYPGFYHEIFNEIGKEAVFSDLESWLQEHLPKAAEPARAGATASLHETRPDHDEPELTI